jgi:glycosyltransferase involved in cell wall biosynthesis
VGKARLVSPARTHGGFSGHLWEQFFLPRSLPAGSLLWSPANTGPLLVRDQVVTIHDLAPLDHPEWYQPAFAAWYRVLIPGLARRARRILTPSEFSKQRILTVLKVPADKVRVAPEGVDPAVFHPRSERDTAQALSRLRLRSPYLLAVGAAPGRKNLDGLLKAWERVYPDFPKVTLAIAGSVYGVFQPGPVNEIAEGVCWLGYLPDDDLAALLSGALAFVYPSLYEGFGLCMLEAMACGAPVLCSNAGALPETAGESANLVNARNAQSLAAGLRELISNSDQRAVMRLKGFEHARAFRWETTAQVVWDELVQAWKEITQKKVQMDVGWLR